MMRDESQQSPQEAVQQQENLILKVLKKFGVRRIITATTDPSYTGGNPKAILDTEDLAVEAAAEQFPVIMPLAHTNAIASGVLVMAEIAPGEFAVVGELGNLPSGKLTTGKYWLAVLPYVAAVSSSAVLTRAQRLDCNQCLTVANVMFEITAGGASLVARVKLYSGDGTLLIDTGDVDCAAAGNKTAAISPAVKITPGTYIVEVTSSSGVSWRCVDLPANFAAVMNIGTTQRATNKTMASASTAVPFPIVKFQA